MATPPIFTSTIFAWDWRGRIYYSLVPYICDSAHKTFGPTDLTSTNSVCTRRIFGDIGHRTQAFCSGVRCSNHQATHGPPLLRSSLSSVKKFHCKKPRFCYQLDIPMHQQTAYCAFFVDTSNLLLLNMAGKAFQSVIDVMLIRSPPVIFFIV
ncbi:hypothetical protein TNCV_2864281 [Trichonephila clavipes]|nr:hypothetical protein TNCV_2864281 [Trichonephila clavipes]